MTTRIIGLVACTLVYGALALAQTEAPEPKLEPLPPPPPMPEPVQSGEPLEPEVTIKQQEKEKIYEYRVNGVLYAIRVVPEVGLPYYLVDADGDGNLETRRNELTPDFLVPAWMILRW